VLLSHVLRQMLRTRLVSIEDSSRILRAIFPNYPELKPCHLAPTLEPIAPFPVNTPVAA